MSIWEVRGKKQQFTYSKILMWVALDRSLRLAEKRSSLPCPNRAKWTETRDAICEDVMEKGYNKEMKCFVQSYESNEVLDSAVLIAPLVFFIAPNDPRFTGTLDQILKAPEKGGLTSTGLVFRYDTEKANDGEFSFCCDHDLENQTLRLTATRCRWFRGSLLNVHILVRRSPDQSRRLRQGKIDCPTNAPSLPPASVPD